MGNNDLDSMGKVLRRIKTRFDAAQLSDEQLQAFVTQSLSAFNEVPPFSNYTLDDIFDKKKVWMIMRYVQFLLETKKDMIANEIDGDPQTSQLIGKFGKQYDSWVIVAKKQKQKLQEQ